jgi:hypothetical protein
MTVIANAINDPKAQRENLGEAHSRRRYASSKVGTYPCVGEISAGRGAEEEARVMALSASRSHKTELATAMQTIQSPPLNAVVPKARWRKGKWTTSTWRATEPPIAAHNHAFVNRRTNALRSSDLAFTTLKI